MFNLVVDHPPTPDGGALNAVGDARLALGPIPSPLAIGLGADVLDARVACEVVGGAGVAWVLERAAVSHGFERR